MTISAQDNFRVGVRYPGIVTEVVTEIFEVIGFAVVRNLVAGLRIVHGLMTGCRGIDDREPRVAEMDSVAACDAGIIRAAVSLRVVHPHHGILRSWARF